MLTYRCTVYQRWQQQLHSQNSVLWITFLAKPRQGLCWSPVWKGNCCFLPSSSPHRKCRMVCSHRKRLNLCDGHADTKGPNVRERNMTWFVRLMRQLTSQGASVKQGRPLSPPPVREARERRLFLHEYQAQECRVELVAAVIASSCGRYAYRSSLPPSACLSSSPPAGGTRGGPELGTADIIAFWLVPCCPEVEDLTQLVASGRNHVTT